MASQEMLRPDKAWEVIEAGAFILDVRSEEECLGGTLPDAVIIPHTEVSSRLSEIPEDLGTPILTYCAVGGRSALVKQELETIGYELVFNGGGYLELAAYFQTLKS